MGRIYFNVAEFFGPSGRILFTADYNIFKRKKYVQKNWKSHVKIEVNWSI